LNTEPFFIIQFSLVVILGVPNVANWNSCFGFQKQKHYLAKIMEIIENILYYFSIRSNETKNL